LVVSDENENTIQKREPLKEFGKFIWVSLIETAKEEEFDFVAEQIKRITFLTTSSSVYMACNEKSIIHKLSHQHLFIKFWK
jgi:A/G-specific adenine glycosylase